MSAASGLPQVVEATWLRERLGLEGLVVGDVRGPNAHARGHIPTSRPLVLGAPPPTSDPERIAELASEVGLRLRRHGVTPDARLVLYDRGDGVGAMPSAQLAELAGHTRVAVLLGGIAAWPADELEVGPVALEPVKTRHEPDLAALPTWQELAARLADPALTILDVRRPEEFSGREGAPCDPRQGHIPGAQLLEAGRLFAAPGRPLPPEQIRSLVGRPAGAEVVAYCHSGARSAVAALALRAAGYRARNYAASWHEWSRHAELPLER